MLTWASEPSIEFMAYAKAPAAWRYSPQSAAPRRAIRDGIKAWSFADWVLAPASLAIAGQAGLKALL
jgi:hypothetical protein